MYNHHHHHVEILIDLSWQLTFCKKKTNGSIKLATKILPFFTLFVNCARVPCSDVLLKNSWFCIENCVVCGHMCAFHFIMIIITTWKCDNNVCQMTKKIYIFSRWMFLALENLANFIDSVCIIMWSGDFCMHLFKSFFTYGCSSSSLKGVVWWKEESEWARM